MPSLFSADTTVVPAAGSHGGGSRSVRVNGYFFPGRKWKGKTPAPQSGSERAARPSRSIALRRRRLRRAIQRCQVGGEIDEVVVGQPRDDRLHQHGERPAAAALLEIIELPRQVAR